MRRLLREFYDRNSVIVAKELLGKYLVHNVNGIELVGKIVETEAYMGPMDKAAHSYNNRRTERNEIMYGPSGYSYVYFIYGMYYCMNVVVEKENIPQAILIRALEPIKGIEQMAVNRFKKSYEDINKRDRKNLTNGPGKLCMALSISREQYGLDLLGEELFILEPEHEEKFEMVSTKRINIDYAEEAIDFPWRFYIQDNSYISKK